MDACTIIAKNYAAHARVLARSFGEHHPDGRFFVLVIDDTDGYLEPGKEPFELLTPSDLACDEFAMMAARYDVLELSTAVKPWLLRHLLDQGSQTITYLDPDIRIFESLNRLEQLCLEHKLVLIPHNTVPIPFDGERPSQVDIMIAGVFNLGYISLSGGWATDQLLEWWSDRLRRDCRVDPVYGYFVDQRWMDLVPGLMPDYAIVRDPEFNVAYWNLHARDLRHDGTSYTVDGRPLAFFHFSGFDPRRPDSLSRHQTRIKLADRPAVDQLCREYAAALDGAAYAVAKSWPYELGRLPDGRPFSPTLRRLFRKGEDRGELHSSPLEDTGYDAFVTWLGGQDEHSPPGITRLLAGIYERRDDLQRAFPDLAGKDRADYIRWAWDHGRAELDLSDRLLPVSEAPAAPLSPAGPAPFPGPPREPPVGVNVVGYFRSELGVGEAGRQMVSALDAVGMPVLPLHGRTMPLSRQEHPFTYLDHSNARYPFNLICMNADALPDFTRHAGRQFFAGRYTIGLWFWEVTATPPGEWAEAFEHVDEVWAPSHHVARAISSVAPVPVVRIPLPIEMPRPASGTRKAFDFSPDEFVFLFSFDYLSVFERKNPLGLVRAFSQAFAHDSGARLVIKCINADRDSLHHGQLQRAIANREDIRLIDHYLAPEAKNALTAACDCYVSLHRAEGFGLTMAEAMVLGKPVIATAYSGNVDFTTAWNSYLVDYTLVPIGEGAAPYPAEGEWADPNLEHAAELMREVFDNPARALERGKRAAVDIRRSHSPAVAGQQIVARLDRIRARAAQDGRAAFLPEPRSLQGLADSVRRGPAPDRAASFPRAALRRSVLRIIRPFTAHQLTVNAQVLETLQDVENKLAPVVGDQLRAEAMYLRDARLRAADRQSATERVDELARRADELAKRADDGAGRLNRLEAETHAIPFVQGTPFVMTNEPGVGTVVAYSAGNGPSARDEYRTFEDVFRGSEEFIRERQRRYLPIIGERRPVFDFGCGRGELLDLLRDEGIPFVAVDLDAGMVARCREKGHADVAHGDGLTHLEEQPDGSLGVVFAAQVIEHLTEAQLRQLLALARRKLRTDGILIAETVNPHSPPALKTFWVDLSHQRPIFPEVALELCREAGFASAYYFHPNGTGDVAQDRFVQGEFAVVASGKPRSPWAADVGS
jgi:glycosyltransferase involved in cell wall biosynthesis/SAM-dependent methyltransferase